MVNSRGDGLSQVSLGPASEHPPTRPYAAQTTDLGNDLGGVGEARQTLHTARHGLQADQLPLRSVDDRPHDGEGPSLGKARQPVGLGVADHSP